MCLMLQVIGEMSVLKDFVLIAPCSAEQNKTPQETSNEGVLGSETSG